MISEWLLKKINVILSILAVIILMGVVIFAANVEIKDLDIWLHLATGRHIAENFSIPKVDVLSATIAGKSWINHEWLFQFITHIFYSLLGVDGLIYLQIGLVAFIFLLLLMMGYQEDLQLVPLITLFFVFMVFQMRFTHRPDLFSLMFFVLYFFILASQLESKRSLVILFFLQILWNNIHGFFILGPCIILIGLAGEWIKRHVSLPFEWNKTARLTDKEYSLLKYAFGMVVLACLFNPHFFEGALYPFKIFWSVSGDSKMFYKHIGELQKPITLDTLLVFQRFFYYKLLILFSALSFILNRKKLDVGLLLFWLFFLLFSLNANRNVVYFAIAAYFVIIANIQQVLTNVHISRFLNNFRAVCVLSIGGKIILILFMLNFGQELSLRGYYDFDHHVRKFEYNGGLSLRNFPYKAVDFLVENHVQGRFFNDFNSGAYLLGRCFPRIRVFIDGRTEVYGVEYFDTYRKAFDGDQEAIDKIFNAYELTGAFLGSVYASPSKQILQYFYQNEEWELVYFDYDATIFLRNIPQNQPIIKKYALDLSTVEVKDIDLTDIGTRRVTPYRNINRANVFLKLGFPEKAKQEAAQAIRVSPYFAEAYEVLGKIALDNNAYSEALENYRKVKLLGGNNLYTARKLARCFYELGAYEKAKKQCSKILEGREDATAFFLLALINVQEGNVNKAGALASKAYALSPSDNFYLRKLGDLMCAKNYPAKAKEVYQLALKLEKDGAAKEEIKQKIAICE